ncbi:major facilitator superfamily domain-containing protein [Mycena vulgaris]|nr:major facilitator superfamily domain-containing protein [Mycena vulgaris]
MSSKSEQEWREETSGTMGKYQPGTEAERKLVRKIDLRIVPTVWLLYVMSYLDRANIGNAESGGMQAELHYGSTQYSIILLMFFVPSNMILTRVRPSIYLSTICVMWGGGSCIWQQLSAVRFCLGVIEAGFAPGVAFYLSSWYKRHELAKRFSIYYTATAISGAFSGLLAGVIIEHLDGARGMAGWRWLLLIEGVGASFVGMWTWIILPDWPTTTSWLTPEEKFIAVQRLSYDGIGTNGGSSVVEPTHGEALKMAITDWRTWVLVVMYMLATGSQTIQYFIPNLVGQLGYKGTEKQFMTIPIYAVALVGILAFCFMSDIRKERGNYITAAACLSGISFIIVVAVDDKKVKYAFLCFAVAGIYAACPLTLMWVSNIIDHPAEKRAVAIAFVNALGNSASIYGSFLWPSATGPRYIQGFTVTTVFVFLLAILAQVNKLLLKKFPSVGLNDNILTGKASHNENQEKLSETGSNV